MPRKSEDSKPKAECKQDEKEKREEGVSEVNDEKLKKKSKGKKNADADSEESKSEKMSEEENNDENRDANIKDGDSEEEKHTKKKRKTNKGEEHPIDTDGKTKGKAKEKESNTDKEEAKTSKSSGSETILSRDFYTRDIVTVSKELLGKIIVRKIGNTVLKCRIAEAEAYGGITDKACHAYNGRKTERTKPMYREGGHVYVYLIHGNISCLNITASKEGDPSAVLIRAVEIVEGYDEIVKNRAMKKVSKSGKELTNGPGRLCAAMKIDKKFNEHDLTKEGELYVIDDKRSVEMVTTKRVNVDYAEEDKDKPWRFCIKDNACVSAKMDPVKEES